MELCIDGISELCIYGIMDLTIDDLWFDCCYDWFIFLINIRKVND